MGVFIRKSSSTSNKYGSIVYYVDDSGFVRRSSSQSDKYGEIVYYYDGDFIRKSNSPSDKYGEIVYYYDGDFIRKSNSPSDKYGEIVYYYDDDGFIRKSSSTSDKYGAIVFYVDKPKEDNQRKKPQPSMDDKKGMLLIVAFIIGLLLAPILVVLAMYNKIPKFELFKNVQPIEAFKKFRKKYSIINFAWLGAGILAIVLFSILGLSGGVSIALYALIGGNITLLVLSIVFGNKIYKEHKHELPEADEENAEVTVVGESQDDGEASVPCEAPAPLEADASINETPDSAEPPRDNSVIQNNILAIKQLKELLDIGAITRREFEQKKKILLGVISEPQDNNKRKKEKKPRDEKKITKIWLYVLFVALGFTVGAYLMNAIFTLAFNGALHWMFRYITNGYLAGFICMGVGLIGFVIALCVLLKKKDAKLKKIGIISSAGMALLLCITLLPLVWYNPLRYEKNSYGTYIVADSYFKGEELEIPSTHKGVPVTSIGEYAFEDCTSLTSVILPDSLVSIDYGAFISCDNLTSVVLGDNVTSIGDYAFSGCTGLTSITIPDSVTRIGNNAFAYCYSLTKINFNATAMYGSLDHFYQGAFNNYGTGGAEISLIIGKNVTRIPANLFRNSSIVSVEFEEGSVCESIGENAFYNCKGLTSITIPNSVTSIGNYAFYNCTGLTSIVIGDSVTSIGDYAFSGCTGLTSVVIGDSVTSIGSSAFYGCSIEELTAPISALSAFDKYNLKTVVITSGENIGDGAFRDCAGLTSVVIGDGVTSIGSSAFYNCTGLTSITIPDSVASIGSSAFYNCKGLTSITIPDSVTTIGGSAFYNCTGLTSIVIGDSVTSIGPFAFEYCTGLTSIVIGEGVTSIGEYAIYGCTGLENVYYKGTESDYREISIRGQNSSLNDAKIYYYSETEQSGSWHYDASGNIVIW